MFDKVLKVVALERLSSRYIAAAIVRRKNGSPIAFVSAYFKPAVGIAPLLRELHSLIEDLSLNTVIGVDTNAHSGKWSYTSSNGSAMAKGRLVIELIEDFDLNEPQSRNGRTDGTPALLAGGRNKTKMPYGAGLLHDTVPWRTR